jgi:hypothetical protein
MTERERQLAFVRHWHPDVLAKMSPDDVARSVSELSAQEIVAANPDLANEINRKAAAAASHSYDVARIFEAAQAGSPFQPPASPLQAAIEDLVQQAVEAQASVHQANLKRSGQGGMEPSLRQLTNQFAGIASAAEVRLAVDRLAQAGRVLLAGILESPAAAKGPDVLILPKSRGARETVREVTSLAVLPKPLP